MALVLFILLEGSPYVNLMTFSCDVYFKYINIFKYVDLHLVLKFGGVNLHSVLELGSVDLHSVLELGSVDLNSVLGFCNFTHRTKPNRDRLQNCRSGHSIVFRSPFTLVVGLFAFDPRPSYLRTCTLTA